MPLILLKRPKEPKRSASGIYSLLVIAAVFAALALYVLMAVLL